MIQPMLAGLLRATRVMIVRFFDLIVAFPVRFVVLTVLVSILGVLFTIFVVVFVIVAASYNARCFKNFFQIAHIIDKHWSSPSKIPKVFFSNSTF